MNTFKKVKVVMLPTNEKAKFNDLVIHPIGGLLVQFKFQNCTEVAQHLYFLSDEEIKVGDWIFHNLDKKPIQWNGEETESNPSVYDYKKIIATTDNSLFGPFEEPLPKGVTSPIPRPSQGFIEKFVEEYNKGNVITEVLVEYEEYHNAPYGVPIMRGRAADTRLKINSRDNTITIRKAKDSWNREEVIELLYKHTEYMLSGKKDTLDKWVEENL